MDKDKEQLLEDIDEYPLTELRDIKRNIEEVLGSIPKLDFSEIAIPDIGEGIRVYFESLPKPASMDESLFPYVSAVEEVFGEGGSITTRISAAAEEFRKQNEEREKALAPIKRQFEVADRIISIGELGWTAVPDTCFDSYMDCPVGDYEKADEYFLKLLEDDVVESLFSEIVSISDSESLDDVLEAIAEYRNGRFKSSALIVFCLIDGVLIRNHKDEVLEMYKQTDQYKRRQRRPVGEAAAKSIAEFFGHNTPASFHFYHYVGLKSCLTKLFADAEDFSIPEYPINRNMLSHGMLKRKVEKKDCLQLFLLFRNLIMYINDYNERFGSEQSSSF